MKNLKKISRIGVAVAALLVIGCLVLPLWKIQLWAPQYPEGLTMRIWHDRMADDYQVISGLNHYIGMKPLKNEMFPEFGYLRYAFYALIAIGLLAAAWGKRLGLYIYLGIMGLFGIIAMTDFYMWGYDYGHNLDPDAAIVVPGMAYQPPLLGYKQLLNFEAFSIPDWGGWAIALADLILVAIVIYELRSDKKKLLPKVAVIALLFMLPALYSCGNTQSQPLIMGKDNCTHCKMTLMDERYGAEIVTKTGKAYKFDDAVCLTKYLQESDLKKEEIDNYYIVDFSAGKGKLIDAQKAFFLKSDKLQSPMAGNIAAFEKQADCLNAQQNLGGQNLSWKNILP